VYLDLGFFQQLQNQLGAAGEFPRAYVIAHEVGHHVQTLLGITDRVRAQRRTASDAESHALSVRVELQADCLAGVWANRADTAHHILEHGDVEQGLAAASAIGDDRLQRRSRGYVVPESFTHGSSEQRVRWFKRGLDSGSVNRCDTFGAPSL
jgi:predicted metalloprotease